jgi:hypothetical protein
METNNDITEQKRAEDDLNKAQGQLAHVTRVATLGELSPRNWRANWKRSGAFAALLH